MIEVFETHCKLPDGSIGEVCKKLTGEEWLVCNAQGWWTCETEWILGNLVSVSGRYHIALNTVGLA